MCHGGSLICNIFAYFCSLYIDQVMNKAMCCNLASPSDASSYSVVLKILVALLNCIHEIAFINHKVR
jgi:hypothetical protein